MRTAADPIVRNNPFPGLRPFREDEEHLFFGREHQVDAMVNKLARTRFLAVVGTSGSGKSSLVNCGLRPALHRGLVASAGTAWRMAQLRPGTDPISAMAGALAQDGVLFCNYQAGGMTLSEIVDTSLRMSKLGLIDIYEQARMGDDTNLLVVVDQFEELFRFKQLGVGQPANVFGVSEAAAAFVNLLLEANKQTTYPIYVVLTMRSDFLGDCTQFPGLAETINAGQYLVPRMNREERREAIRGPVEVGGAEISSVLLTRLVNDVGDNPDQLSILQHALNRTWARWEYEGGRIGPLDVAHYEAIGTMAHALDQHAEKAYSELNTQRKQELCEKIFKALTDKATDVRGVRCPTTFDTLCELVDATAEEVKAVIDVFRKPSRSFLMPPSEEVLEVGTVIDISHESLMRVWQRLSTWADEEALSAQTYRRLAETAELHAKGQASLWRDTDLQVALDWRDKRQPNTIWAQRYHAGFVQAMNFLDASVARRDEELYKEEAQRQEQEAQRQHALEQAQALAKKEQQRAEEQTKASRRFRWISIALAIAFIIALGAATWAIQQKKLATLRSLEATALGHIEKVDLSLLLSLEALRINDEPEHIDVLLRALRQSPRLMTFLHGHTDAVRSVVWSPNGKTLASGSWDSTIILWDLTTRKPLGPPLTGHTNAVYTLAWSSDGKILASGSWDSTIILWDVATRKPLGPPLTGHTNAVYTLAWSPDGTTLASGGDDKTIRLWDVATRRQLGPPLTGHANAVRSLTWSPDGTTLASGSKDDTIRLWDVLTRQPLGPPLVGHSDAVRSVAWSPDGTTLASGSGDKTILLWDVTTQRQGQPLIGHKNTVYSVAWNPDGKILASGGEDFSILLWDASSGRLLSKLPGGHTDGVRSIAWSSDGKFLASGSWDSTILLWDMATRKPLKAPLVGHTGPVLSVAWSPDGKTVASGGNDKTIRMWEVATGKQLGTVRSSRNDNVHSIAWSSDGTTIAAGTEDGTILLWNVATGQRRDLLMPSGHATAIRSVAWSPDNTTLASGGDDKTIRIWDVANHYNKLTLVGHANSVYRVIWSPDGKTIAASNEDSTISLWDVVTGQPVGVPLTGHTDAVYTIAWSPDGTTLASGGNDYTIRRWDMVTNRSVQPSPYDPLKLRACRVANRNFTRTEWQHYMGGARYRVTCPDLPIPKE